MANSGRVEIRITAKGDKEVNAAFGRVRRSLTGTQVDVFSLRSALGALGIGLLARDLGQAALAWERFEGKVAGAVGEGEAARREIGFIRAEAKRLGLELRSAGDDFGSLAASAKGTALAGQGTRDIFSAVAEASTVMKLSADDTSGAIRAIGQMMSKGTVQAEELRGQLGERIPGAFNIAARAMDVSTMQLGKMLEQGEVVADDFLPRFAAELRKTFADQLPSAVDSAQARINRFGNLIFELKVKLANSGFMAFFLNALDWLTNTGIPTMQALFWSLIAGLLKGWEYLRYGTAVVLESIKQAFLLAFEWIGRYYAGWLNMFAAGMEKVPFLKDQAAGLRGFADEIEGATRRTENFEEAMTRLKREKDAIFASIDQIAGDNVAAALNPDIEVLPPSSGGGMPQLPLLPDQADDGKAAADKSDQVERIRQQLNALTMELASEEERLFQAAVRRSEMVLAARENDLIGEQTQRDLLLQIEEDYQRRLTEIEKKGLSERETWEQASWSERISIVAADMNKMTAMTAANNNAMFRINQAARVIEAGQEAVRGAIRTWNAYPYPWNVPMTALHVAGSAAYLSQLVGAKPQGGGTTIGHGAGTPTSPVITDQAQQEEKEREPSRSVNVQIFAGASVLDNHSMDEFARKIASNMDKYYSDGGR